MEATTPMPFWLQKGSVPLVVAVQPKKQQPEPHPSTIRKVREWVKEWEELKMIDESEYDWEIVSGEHCQKGVPQTIKFAWGGRKNLGDFQ